MGGEEENKELHMLLGWADLLAFCLFYCNNLALP